MFSDKEINRLMRSSRLFRNLVNRLNKYLSHRMIAPYFWTFYRSTLVSSFPLYASIEITNACNLRCLHCQYRYGVAHYTRPKGFIDIQLFKKIVDELNEHGSDVQMGADGEALLHPKFLDMLHYVCRLPRIGKINFNTNGTLLTPEKIDQLLTFYRGYIYFSLEGDREFHNRQRVGSDYDLVVGNLKYLTDRIARQGNKQVKVGVNMCNVDHTPETRNAFVEQWIDKVDFVIMAEVNDANGRIISKNRMLDPRRLSRKRFPCAMPWTSFEIGFDGSVSPCSIYITRGNTAEYGDLGNVKHASLKEIWNGEPAKKFRKLHTKNKLGKTLCAHCERWQHQVRIADEFHDDIHIKRNAIWSTFSKSYDEWLT